VPHHEQQASKCNGEQQHRVLWPAYNLNIAPPQASTQGLFQQTQAFAPTTSVLARVQRLNACELAAVCPNPMLR